VIARFFILTLVASALAAAPAAGQGKGKGLGKRGGNSPQAPAPVIIDTESGAPLAGSGLRQFGSWLDDASMIDAGSAWTAISFAHTRSAGARQTDFPVADLSYGMSPRAQVGLSFPYYRMQFADGTAIDGVGDVYLTATFGLVSPDAKRNRLWGLSVTPIIEVLEEATPGASRFGLGLPVNAELRLGSARIYGSTGFFTRGAVFASGALEVPVHERVIVTGALSAMRATNEDEVADALALPRSRTDLNVVAAYFLTPQMAVFGGTGRTLSNASTVGSSLQITAGISFSM
jgi:hypothetical protein